MITQTINLNLIPGGVLPRINVSQYDKGSRTLNFNIYNGSVLFNIPSGCSITIQGTKPDRTAFQYSCEYEGSVVTADLEQQMSVLAGDVVCEIAINKNTNLIGTGNFILCVEPAAVASDTVISETELPLIEQAIEAASEAEASAASAAESAAEAAAWSSNAPYIGENGNWFVYDPETEQFIDTGDPSRGPQGIQGETGPQGTTGVTPDITMNVSVDNTTGTPSVVVTETGTDEDPIFSLAFSGLKGPQGETGEQGETGPQGPAGPTGNGISNITKTGTSGLVDTYTITYTDGTTSTFTVTNGQDGTGSGDMSMSDYDPTGSVKNDGGIPDFIADQISGKQNIILSSALPIGGINRTTVENALGALNEAKQNIILSSALTIGGQTVTEVEEALHALNNKPSGSGGHTILDSEGVTMPQRAKLKFVGCTVTDDSTNDTTIIEAEGGGGGTTIVQIPYVVIGTYTYDGTQQAPTITGLDTTNTKITGTYEATNAGEYTFTISLKDKTKMVWSDMSITDLTYTWSIAKSTCPTTASTNSVTLDASHLTATVNLSDVTGTVTISSSDTTVATVSESGGVVTISSVNNTTGNATITIDIAASTNYLAGSLSVSVSAEFSVNVTLYSAASDTITFTDGSGSCTVVTDSSGKAENVTIYLTGSPIAFTSSIAKDPDNLSNVYTKSITVTNNMTEIKLMPDNVIYWYGYKGNYTWSRNSNDVSFSYGTNFLHGSINNAGIKGGYATDQLIDLSPYSVLKAFIYSVSCTPTSSFGSYVEFHISPNRSDSGTYGYNKLVESNAGQSTRSYSNFINSRSCPDVNGYLYFQLRGQPASCIVSAVWLE